MGCCITSIVEYSGEARGANKTSMAYAPAAGSEQHGASGPSPRRDVYGCKRGEYGRKNVGRSEKMMIHAAGQEK